MSLSRYGDYKPVEFGWLRELPSHWEVFPLKRAAELGCLKRDVAAVDRYVGLENVSSWTGRIAVAEVPAEGLGIEFGAGDVLFGKLRPYLAKVALAETSGIASTEFLILRGQRVDPSFLRYSMVSRPFIDAVNASTYGAKMPRASWEDIGSLPQPIPPPAEQRAIAAFLDRETTKIDALIAKQEQLIQSIEEHRRAYVYSCVTRGLETRAALVDSGIPWLGLIPAHWNVRPLKYFAAFYAGAGFPDAEQGLSDEELPFFKVKDLGSLGPDALLVSTDNTISRQTAKRLRAHLFPPRTIVMAKIGAALLLNRFRMVGVPCCLDNNMLGIECDYRKIDPDFALLLIGAVLDMRMLVNPGAVPSLNETRLGRLKIAVPSLSEQRAIVGHLRRETEKLGQLRHRAIDAVRVLQERRSALITAAVTGEIEVATNIAAEAAA